ncbi:MAG: hypothetical protein V3U59_03805 [Gammaproteobacteria bacterium]
MATDTPTEQKDIPILHDVVARGQSELYEALQAPDLPEIGENELALLQTELASRIHQLADGLLHRAIQEMEAVLFEKVSNAMREQLPELVDDILWSHFQKPKR